MTFLNTFGKQKMGSINADIVLGETSTSVKSRIIMDFFKGENFIPMAKLSVSANSVGSMLQLKTGTAYQVPTGKKARVYFLIVLSVATNSSVKIYSSNTVNTADGDLLWDMTAAYPTGNAVCTPVLEFVAGRYLTIHDADLDSNIQVYAFVIEGDA